MKNCSVSFVSMRLLPSAALYSGSVSSLIKLRGKGNSSSGRRVCVSTALRFSRFIKDYVVAFPVERSWDSYPEGNEIYLLPI